MCRTVVHAPDEECDEERAAWEQKRSGGPSRRGLLAAGLLAPAAALWHPGRAAAAEPAAAPVAAPEDGMSAGFDKDSPRFTLAVLPDVQYLFDDDYDNRSDPAPASSTFGYLSRNTGLDNIAFMAQLGDITEHGLETECSLADTSFSAIDPKLSYSVLAGNHDIRGDDTRGDTPFLDHFGPKRFAKSPTFGGSSPDGYSTYNVFPAAGREWLIFALDWRVTDNTVTWANGVIAANPTLPVIMTTHEFVQPDDDNGTGSLSGYGQTLFKEFVNDNDQIFLTLNGHFWPPARTTLTNARGNPVQAHLSNYQDRYYGGSASIRYYRFDLSRNTIDVSTFSPYFLGIDPESRAPLAQREVELTDATNRFSLPLDFDARFAGFAPKAKILPRTPAQVMVTGTLAYWRPGEGIADGANVPAGHVVRDESGNGNDLTVALQPGSPATSLIGYSSDFEPDEPSQTSLRFNAGTGPTTGGQGAYLATAAGAPINSATFPDGYTIETFVKIPAAFDNGGHAFMGIFSWAGQSGDVGKGDAPGGDPQEPLCSLNVSGERYLQFLAYAPDQKGAQTAWSHAIPTETWVHVAVVNDGSEIRMYVDRSLITRNPMTRSAGITTYGTPFVIGSTQYAKQFDNLAFAYIGDLRIVGRGLAPSEFLTAGASASTPPAALPEAPAALALPAAGLAVAAGTLAYRRHQAGRTDSGPA